MDSQSECIVGRSPSWSSTATWTIISGSIENTVVYESFYCPIDEEDTADARCSKSPIVLRRPSAESGPCEITLRFAEKHEIRQVYVRSTARVYEIYYATNSQNENEYLCTVRCGAARRDDEVLHATSTEDVSTHMKGPDEDVAERLKISSNLNSSEEDWVEVKVPDSPALDHKNNSSQSMSTADSATVRQNLYEATAEIADANPCTSLTIRLLSLQNKSYVYVDEVYVFANPVDSEEDGPVENPAQSSLMSMLVPTLMQLSKTTSSNKKDNGRTSNAEGMPEIGSKALGSINNLNGLQQERKPRVTDCDEVNLRETNESDRAGGQSEAPVQVSPEKSKHDEPFHRIESILDQLVSRMNRIENCFLRFEENMLKPINSIEGRLKQVEQQLEILTKESHVSELPHCYRMSAPIFSGNESGSNSFYNSGNDHPSCGPIESDGKELYSRLSSIALDTFNSVNSSLLHPSLVVTAPEFSNGDGDDDDDEENLSLEVAADSLPSKPKASIDDILASALARFASSSSIKTPESTKTEAVRPPDFLNEDDGNNYMGALPSDPPEIEIDHISCPEKIDGTQCIMNSASNSSPPSSANGENLSSSGDENSSKLAGEDHLQVLRDLECEYQSAAGDIGVSNQNMEAIEEIGNVEVINATSDDLVSEKRDVPPHSPHSDTEHDPGATEVYVVEVTKEGCDIDIVHDVLGFSRDVSVVNFEIPILDVDFTSITDLNSEHTLKDLLDDMPGLNYGAPCLKESDDATPKGKQCDLISVEDEGRADPVPTNRHLSVDMNYYTIMDEPFVANGENQEDHCPCSNHNTIISSLI